VRCPTLGELPPPPSGKSGWPWTVGGGQLPDARLDGLPWPKVSIVTPSYNQAQFIEETIRSVLLQGYPNLEYIIIDGGSTDGSMGIIRKYEPWLAYWVSEPDEGQSDAINKGFTHSRGSVLTWLNSDDRFQPRAIKEATRFFQENPDVEIAYGNYTEIDENSRLLRTFQSPEFNLHRQMVRQLIPQPAAFFRRAVWEQIGPLDTSLHYVMDRDLWNRAALCFSIEHFPALIADMRMHSHSKTIGQTVCFMQELEKFYDRFFSLPELPPSIKNLELEARGANYFSMGRAYLKSNQLREARQAFEQAWHTYPFALKKLIILPFYLDASCKTNMGWPLFTLAVRVKHLWQRLHH